MGEMALSRQSIGSDPFSRLASELQLAITDELDISDLLHLREASTRIRALMSNSFWKVRLQRDMPWLYDLPEPGAQTKVDLIDWTQVYKDMYRASSLSPKQQGRILGLVNRRRLWETTIPQILEPYWVIKRENIDYTISGISKLRTQ